jgi:hypothetical protein
MQISADRHKCAPGGVLMLKAMDSSQAGVLKTE